MLAPPAYPRLSPKSWVGTWPDPAQTTGLPGAISHSATPNVSSCHDAPRVDVHGLPLQEIDMSLLPAPNPAPCADPLTEFVAHARPMLDPATPEALRRETEPRLLALLPTMLALGVFELFTIRDPALRELVLDELAERPHARRLAVVAGA